MVLSLADIACQHSATRQEVPRVRVQEAASHCGKTSPFTQAGDMISELAELEDQFGTQRGATNQWASCVRIVRPAADALHTLSVLHLDNNEAALCMCLVTFGAQGAAAGAGAPMLAVGTAKGLSFMPRQAEGARLAASITLLWCARGMWVLEARS